MSSDPPASVPSDGSKGTCHHAGLGSSAVIAHLTPSSQETVLKTIINSNVLYAKELQDAVWRSQVLKNDYIV